mgnify:CR=1 FL=1
MEHLHGPSMSNEELADYTPRIEGLARDHGLSFYPVDFELVPSSFMMEVAVYGLPVRMPHWSFGVRYIYQYVQHRMGHSKIFEVVFPGNPNRAYLVDDNGLPENTLVTAHVLGHADFSRNNQLFDRMQQEVGYHIVEQAAERANRIQAAIDNGASACYVNGGWADRWHLENKTLLLNKSVERIKAHGVPAGIGAPSLQPIMACEAADFNPDFYMKTLHHHNYWSARGGDLNKPVVKNGADNLWAATPEQTKRFMKSVDTPWFAFKVMAAGAIPPRSAFSYAFEGGADCILAGMFDWQVEEDVQMAKQVMRKVAQNGRQRPWRA